MKIRVFVASAITLGFAVTAEAQSTCSAGNAQQACQTAVDLVNFMSPQLGTAIAAGSSSLAQSGVLGGLGRFALTIRGTGVMNGSFPNINSQAFNTNGTAQTYTSKDQAIPGAGVDFSVGLWEGINLGATHMGGIDAIASALYLPDKDGGTSEISIKAKDGNLKIGYGARVGILDEGVVWPGIYVSYLQRDLPTVTLSGQGAQGNGATTTSGTVTLSDYSVKTTAIRLVAQKSLLIFGITAGVGQDDYKGSSHVTASVTSPIQSTSSADISMDLKRTNVFAGVSFNLFIFKVAVEAGQVTGGTIGNTVNHFGSQQPGDSRTYVSGGLRLAF